MLSAAFHRGTGRACPGPVSAARGTSAADRRAATPASLAMNAAISTSSAPTISVPRMSRWPPMRSGPFPRRPRSRRQRHGRAEVAGRERRPGPFELGARVAPDQPEVLQRARGCGRPTSAATIVAIAPSSASASSIIASGPVGPSNAACSLAGTVSPAAAAAASRPRPVGPARRAPAPSRAVGLAELPRGHRVPNCRRQLPRACGRHDVPILGTGHRARLEQRLLLGPDDPAPPQVGVIGAGLGLEQVEQPAPVGWLATRWGAAPSAPAAAPPAGWYADSWREAAAHTAWSAGPPARSAISAASR